MQHLNIEDLARLVEEEPRDEEAAHLAECGACREELAALAEQTAALADLPDLMPPASLWPALEARLESEALVRATVPSRRSAAWKVAAALALFVAGGATGALARGGLPSPAAKEGAPAALVQAPPASAAEAAERLRGAEAQYLAALTQYAELTGAARTEDPVNRLAALEGIVLTTRAALKDAPADPVINGYHLAAVGQRDALLRQINHRDDQRTWY